MENPSNPNPRFFGLNATAVSVQNAVKSYTNGDLILNNLNMTVEEGTIYGLLGASGCGKSTLLSCIVGLRRLNRGTITVFGSPPGSYKGSVGFMPQDLVLYPVFSVKELLTYFGTIYGMSSSQINQRIEFLTEMLHLPETNNRISTFSGGEGRRTSLALSMLHQPPLLILDEPTVGVDPLVRNKIWNHLTDLTNRTKTTIIITTHYIQECRSCDKVGILRNGRLLTESSPESLLQVHKTILLEDVMLTLCKQDTRIDTMQSQAETESNLSNLRRKYENSTTLSYDNEQVLGIKFKARCPDYNTVKPKYQNHHRNSRNKDSKSNKPKNLKNINSGTHWQKILALLIGHVLNMIRHPMFFISQIIMPGLQVLMLNLILGPDPVGLSVGFVNHDLSFPVNPTNCEHRVNIGACIEPGILCNYMKLLSEDMGGTVSWEEFSSEEEALLSAQKGGIRGFISIPANFTNHLKDRILLGKFAENDTISGSTITSRMDLSNTLISNFLQKTMVEQFLKFLSNEAENCGQNPKLVETPLRLRNIFEHSHLGHNDVDAGTSMSNFIQPALILWIAFLMPLGSCIAMSIERKIGFVDRIVVAGVTFLDIFIARVIFEGAVLVLELISCFLVVIYIFDFVYSGSIVLIVLIVFMTGIIGLSFGFVLGTFVSEPLEAIFGMTAIFLTSLYLSGGLWPISSITPWMRIITYFTPITLPLEALRAVINRGWGLSHPVILQGIGAFVVWTSINSLISGINHKINNR